MSYFDNLMRELKEFSRLVLSTEYCYKCKKKSFKTIELIIQNHLLSENIILDVCLCEKCFTEIIKKVIK